MPLTDFINHPHALMIAPAGHGKTHAIAQCVKESQSSGRFLILTHTHAGIASLKEKFTQMQVPTQKYHVETICGFVQRYVLGLEGNHDLPPEGDKLYFSKILERGVKLFNIQSVLHIVKLTYAGLYVDEYQDCTKDQHWIISAIAKILPTHLFGDPLQGIFDFSHSPVDFEKDLVDWERFDMLKHPYRWDKSNPQLGESIKQIREHLLRKETFQLPINDSGISVVPIVPIKTYGQLPELVKAIRNEHTDSLLVIEPESFDNGGVPYGNINARARNLSYFDFSHQFQLLEAIDENLYYHLAKSTDELLKKVNNTKLRLSIETCLYGWLSECKFKKGDIDKWVTKQHVISKRGTDQVKSNELKSLYADFKERKDENSLFAILQFFHNNKCRSTRPEVFSTLYHCFQRSGTCEKTFVERMQLNRNVIRRAGRKIYGKCYGTTLLTKGLEFDVVIINNAHLIKDAKNFYVAISRACKKLIVLTASNTFSFEDNSMII